MPRVVALLTAALLAVVGLTGCRAEDKMVVAFLVAADAAPRWTQSDEPAFADYIGFHCPDCVYVKKLAEGDADRQAEQLDDVIAAGADVVVLNAVNGEVGEAMVRKAHQAKVMVIAYDRFVPGADFYVSYDAGAIGRQMAKAAVDRIPAKGSVLVVNGAQTDTNGVEIKRAVHRVLDKAKISVLAELDPKTWSAEEARTWVRSQLAKRPAADIDAIIAANDQQAEGVAQALTAARVSPQNRPLVTGQDADLAALRRIIVGTQTLTVFKSYPHQAEQAAQIAVDLVTDQKVEAPEQVKDVPAFVFQPLVVTIDNLADAIVRDQIFSLDELCAGRVTAACTRQGLR